jgi:hypothetical protein
VTRVAHAGKWNRGRTNCVQCEQHQGEHRAAVEFPVDFPASCSMARRIGFGFAVAVTGARTSERSREFTNRFLMPSAGQVGEAACEAEHGWLRLGTYRGRARPQALEEVARINTERLRNRVEPSDCNPVRPALVFVRLLIGDADKLSQLLLGQTAHDAALAYPPAYMPVDVGGASPDGPWVRSGSCRACGHG